MLKATMPKEVILNAKVPNKTCVRSFVLISYEPTGFRELVTVRIFASSSTGPAIAVIWVHPKAGVQCSGTGRASGYGYHKGSAAVESAIKSAGISLHGMLGEPEYYNHSESRSYTPEERKAMAEAAEGKPAFIGGAGDDAIEEAMRAIADAVLPEKTPCHIVKFWANY